MKPNLSIIFLFLHFLALATINISLCNRTTDLNCHESERQALLRFKQDLEDPSNRLASWSGDGDCCTWDGVVCDNLTGHVLQLHLQNPFDPSNDSEYEAFRSSELGGKINPSLLHLKDLIYLNLSNNDFEGIQIPKFLGSLGKLRYLDLSGAGFSGMIPHQLGNLSFLKYLDLGDVGDYGNDLYADNAFWLSGLSLLEHLDLSQVNLNKSSQWLQAINNLSVLKVLKLSNCRLPNFPPLPIANFSSLTILDLSQNLLSNPFPKWIFGLSDLVFLSLSLTSFEGPIPVGLQNLTSIRHFDLSLNNFNCSFPNWLYKFSFLETLDLQDSQLFGHLTNELGKLKNLVYLDLSSNSISGSIPLSLGKLLSLEYLDLSDNKLNGTITEIHFANLRRLDTFSAYQNSLTLKFSPDWLPPFQLEYLILDSCDVGPTFPLWLLSQNNLKSLVISNSSISDIIPERFWKVFSSISYLDLSLNQFHGELPNLINIASLEILYLNSNNLSGPLPLISSKQLIELDLSNNNFWGSTSQFFCYRVNETKKMQILNLKDNALFGELPDCWMNWRHLRSLNLGNNFLTCDLPTSMGNLTSLQALHLQKNNLTGRILASLQSMNKLTVLQMHGNQFVGQVPAWIGERFSRMRVLNLRSNKLHGTFPPELCRLSSLQILDLAENNLSGTIPVCVKNFRAMATIEDFENTSIRFSTSNDFFYEGVVLVIKGKMIEYSSTLNLVRSIDLSKNNFFGEIPVEVTNLQALQSLNLSQNFLTGRIPKTIGAMSSLESLDLSGNLLSSEIPSSISNLTFLSHLNLSNNNLTGMIPLSTQLQSLDASCFAGNELCGDPLPKKCTVMTNSMPNHKETGEDGDEPEVNWFYVSMPLGFVVGFWGVIGPLVVNKRWRYKYCHFLDHLGNKLNFSL